MHFQCTFWAKMARNDHFLVVFYPYFLIFLIIFYMIYALLVHILTKICQNIDNLDVYHALFLVDFTSALIWFVHFQFAFWPKIAQNIEWLGVFYLYFYSICALSIHILRQNASKYRIIRGILPLILYDSCTFSAHFPSN